MLFKLKKETSAQRIQNIFVCRYLVVIVVVDSCDRVLKSSSHDSLGFTFSWNPFGNTTVLMRTKT